jgi:glucose/arabinose dehydrogenase
MSTNGEGGLTGLEINPISFASDHWLYIMHTSAGTDGPRDNRIVRIKLTADFHLDTSTEQVLVRGIAQNKFHNGGRLRFSPDGKFLFAGTGDAQNGSNAQKTTSLNGKVLRINPDGSIPTDNPFHNAVWSYGHRNIQGLAFDSQGRLWEQEFGDSKQDETNLITRGGNYGWPTCEGTVSHGGGGCGTAGFIAPKHTYSVGSGSCSGIAIVGDHLWVACQRGTRLYRETISGSSLTDVRSLLVGTYKRLRTVEPAPDGGLWLATSNGGDKDSTRDNSHNQIFHLTLGS